MKTLKGLTFGVLPKITYDPVLAGRAALLLAFLLHRDVEHYTDDTFRTYVSRRDYAGMVMHNDLGDGGCDN